MVLSDSPRSMRSFISLSLALATSHGPENAAPGWLQEPAVSPQPQVHMSCFPSALARSLLSTGAWAKRGAAKAAARSSAKREKQIVRLQISEMPEGLCRAEDRGATFTPFTSGTEAPVVPRR